MTKLTPQELRAAAERARKFPAGRAGFYVYAGLPLKHNSNTSDHAADLVNSHPELLDKC